MDFAQSADSALKLIRDAAGASLVLILSDINMPGMTGHSRHVDIGKDQYQRCTRRVTDQFKRAVCRLRKIHREAAVADVASESLAKQRLNIGFVVNNKNI